MGKTVCCQVGEVSVLIDVDSDEIPDGEKDYELWRAETFATKEPETLSWIDTYIDPGDVLYDIGANIGQYSLYAAGLLKGECCIFAFEPEALNFAKLNKNIVLNEFCDSITAFCLAVADQTEIGSFYVNKFTPGAALHSWGKPETQGEREFSPENQQGMFAVSLDDLTGCFGLDFPNHLKIDVDGLEEEIVEGATRTLRDPRLRSVLIEVYMYKDTARRINKKIEESGFILKNADSIDYTPGIVQNLIYSRA